MFDRLSELTEIKNYCQTIRALDEELAELLSPLIEAVDKKIAVQMEIDEPRAYNINNRIRILRGIKRIEYFRQAGMTDDEVDYFGSLLGRYVDWQHPGLDLWPGTGQLLPRVLGAEPLYTVDWDQEVLDHVSKQFNEFYAERRLMQYKISKYDMSTLPQNSFGIVYSLNWSIYENLENQLTIAAAVNDLLLPGGTYLFNYIPLDLAWGCSELKTTGAGLDSDKMRDGLTALGFEIIENRKASRWYSHFLCKKPGTLSNVKTSSIIAKVIDKSDELQYTKKD